MNLPFRTFIAGMTLAVATTAAHGHGATLGDLAIAHPYAVATPPGATTGAGSIKSIANQGAADDRLVGASSPVADHVELHAMTMDGDVMRMRQVPGIVIPAKGQVEIAPGKGYHLMLVGIRQPLKLGERIPMKLSFEKAGTVDVELVVQESGAVAEPHRH